MECETGKDCYEEATNLILEEEKVLELIRVLMDDDPEGALDFLKTHFNSRERLATFSKAAER